MASLNKLAIRGIRSFDSDHVSVIQFFTPVTVIVGHNGSGKTTIIECLKYATTGDQPPNTRGGAFVHDPKLVNEKEVKAQVKLRFHAANGQRMLVVRNLSVTVKKTGAMTMKTLESILALEQDTRTGKRATISTKCAEMDIEVPHLLGVSKAVLENVIFCHQEDSYWPLSEPSILKKKFDDIFEATKYTKALDNIKALRKDRVAELKAEKEHLESLSKEKGHSDKLRSRISDLTRAIAEKEIELDETKAEYDKLAVANQKFYDSSSKFREVYVKVENLTKELSHYQEELDSARENLHEIPGTDEELRDRLKNFHEHIREKKEKKKSEEAKMEDIDDELGNTRKSLADKLTARGQLEAEAQAQEQRIAEREARIREISAKHMIKGYDHSPLEKEKVAEFIDKLSQLRKRQHNETEALQQEHREMTTAYNEKSRRLHGDLASLKAQKDNARERMATVNSSIAECEKKVDEADTLTSDLRTIEIDIEEKERRIQKAHDDIKAADFEARLTENGKKARELELKKEDLDTEITTLSLQADSRARLDIKREALRARSSEMKNTLEINNPKFRKLVGTDARADTMVSVLERVSNDKEREHDELQSLSDHAGKELSAIEMTLSNLQEQVKVKKQEIKKLDAAIKKGLEAFDTTSTDDALEEAKRELQDREQELHRTEGAGDVWNDFLRHGKSKKRCPLCMRDMNDKDMATYEKIVGEQIKKSTPAGIKEIKQEVKDWESELKRLQDLAVVAAERDKLKSNQLPLLERQVEEKEAELPVASKKAEEALERLNIVKKELREIAGLKPHATAVSRFHQEIQGLERDIASIEAELQSTGSTKTVEEVQSELDGLKNNLRVIEREKLAITADRDRQLDALRTHEHELHSLQLRLSDVNGKLRDKSALEKRIAEMKQEVEGISTRLKTLDSKIAESESVVQRFELEHKQIEAELNQKITEAQESSQELNASFDKLEVYNRNIERYVRDKRGRLLKETISQIEDIRAEEQQLTTQLEEVRAVINAIEKEVNEGGSFIGDLRENLRVRKLVQDIAETQRQIDECDMEAAAKARRNFNDQYQKEKDRETAMQTKYGQLTGELNASRKQLVELEDDLKAFKEINKRYRDQLIKVKMSDMANNDLEKYAKALDNAIMKYHALKMEEVNDTMRHLWNKTYQGTDIDGIKISSDSEGGITKRSYNYRVVMTKDQVEMDMRGRCSAGQKMLASIIIRLALADSFGQNCGILALDEPTNALDTENIDALAASLIDIINERKKQSNFQLIIITHDENFLKKLGQSDVMEYYWRVSRDPKQKSIIERHRFG